MMMTWTIFIIGAVLLVGSGCMKVNNWREQIHCWFGAWTGIIIMFASLAWEYGK